MRTTLQIDDDVLETARRIAKADGRGLGEVISDLARRSLRPVGIRVDSGFPVFDVEINAPTFGPDEVARALDDE